ncbi:TonB-dependent receptor [Spongiibacter sp.]|uniref:TonB-dependent receptor n=1 Tax=Spongiibacter sp. TaxID=2024860 RepID=UPI003566715B
MNKVGLVAALVAAAFASAALSEEYQRAAHIEEVIVTAQKRSESIQDVPIAVSVLSAERMKNSAIVSFEDISLASPNTEINMTPGYVQVGMRGLNSPINDGMEQAVGVYVDGIYYGKTAFLQDAFLDLARVEMLKGPQGTLFGKNTVAGAISISTARPEDEWRLSARASQGQFSGEKYEAMVNAPLIEERLALRVAAARERRDGYVNNVLRGRDEKRVDKEGWRAKLLFTPLETLTAVLTYYQGAARDSGQGWEPFVLGDDAAQVHGAFDSSLEANFDYRSHADAPNESRSDTEVWNLEANWEVADHLLTLIASTARAEEWLYLDADTASAPIADWGRATDYGQQMLELRLSSPPGRLEYLLGAFAFRSDNDLTGELRALPKGPLQGVLLPALGAETVAALFGGALDPLDGGLGALATDALHQRFIQRTETLALFSQLTWNISERLSLIAGLRASQEEKDVDLEQNYEQTGLLLQAAFGVTEYELDDRREESNIAPKLSLKYSLGDDLLYASYSEGFKAGGYNPLARTADESGFEQERAKAYELGYKITAYDGVLTVNTALYHTAFSDMQIQAFIGNGFIVNNAAQATTEGAEIDISWQPWRGSQFFASWGYSDARFERYEDGPCPADSSEETCDLSGSQLPRAPKLSASAGFNVALPLWREQLAVMLGGDVSWRDDILFDLDADPIDSQAAYHLINVHVGVVDPDGRWQLMAHIKNLENNRVRHFAADMPIFSGSHMGFLMPPRMFSAELSLAW